MIFTDSLELLLILLKCRRSYFWQDPVTELMWCILTLTSWQGLEKLILI